MDLLLKPQNIVGIYPQGPVGHHDFLLKFRSGYPSEKCSWVMCNILNPKLIEKECPERMFQSRVKKQTGEKGKGKGKGAPGQGKGRGRNGKGAPRGLAPVGAPPQHPPQAPAAPPHPPKLPPQQGQIHRVVAQTRTLLPRNH